jgi:hypothetical protein
VARAATRHPAGPHTPLPLIPFAGATAPPRPTAAPELEGNRSRGGQRGLLRDLTGIPQTCWIRALVVPQMRDRLEPTSMESGQCLTWRSPTTRVPADLDLPSYQQ